MFLWLRGQGGRERDPGRQKEVVAGGFLFLKKCFSL